MAGAVRFAKFKLWAGGGAGAVAEDTIYFDIEMLIIFEVIECERKVVFVRFNYHCMKRSKERYENEVRIRVSDRIF